MNTLSIDHNIWLNKEQRYSLHEGNEINVVGISIPVWIFEDKTTNEPAKEIFCKYKLINNKNFDAPIKITEDGYEITIPCIQGTSLNLTNEEWRELNAKNPDKLEKLYDICVKPINSKNLLDIKDGGSKYMSYKEKAICQIDGKEINFIHSICITDMEDSESTIY